jgi:hypothetical protein
MVLPKPVEGFRFDKTKDEWELIENVALEGEPTLTLDTFLLEGESRMIGHIMLERSKEDVENRGARAGQLHAERILEQQDKIPVEWRKFYLVFTGTVWRSPRGVLYVPCLRWYAAGWHLDWYWLGLNCYDYDRLVRLGK